MWTVDDRQVALGDWGCFFMEYITNSWSVQSKNFFLHLSRAGSSSTGWQCTGFQTFMWTANHCLGHLCRPNTCRCYIHEVNGIITPCLSFPHFLMCAYMTLAECVSALLPISSGKLTHGRIWNVPHRTFRREAGVAVGFASPSLFDVGRVGRRSDSAKQTLGP